MSQLNIFHTNSLGSSYIPNYKQAARIQTFIDNHPNANQNKKYTRAIAPLNISTNNNYLMDLSYNLDTNNNSITFYGQINKKNFHIVDFNIYQNNNNCNIDYIYNNINGNIEFTIHNFENKTCRLQINGTLKMASITHYVTYYYNYLVN